MKHRIKVVLDANVASGGQPVRAWLQYDTETEKTIKECRKAFAKQLGLNDADALELAIEGEFSSSAAAVKARLTSFEQASSFWTASRPIL